MHLPHDRRPTLSPTRWLPVDGTHMHLTGTLAGHVQLGPGPPPTVRDPVQRLLDRDRAIFDRDDPVTAVRPKARVALLIDREPHACAPPQPAAGQFTHPHGELDSGHALQL